MLFKILNSEIICSKSFTELIEFGWKEHVIASIFSLLKAKAVLH